MSLVWQAKGEHNIARGYRDELFTVDGKGHRRSMHPRAKRGVP